MLQATLGIPALTVLAGCTQASVRIAVPWSGWELARFRDVLRAFSKRYELGTELVPLGDDIAAVLSATASGAPDVVMLPRPGRARELHERLEPLEWAWQPPGKFSTDWRAALDDNGQVYGVPFKAANKSVLWYRTDLVGWNTPPNSWPELVGACRRLAGSAVAPLAIGAADGWPLSDLFENVLLALDPETYRLLAGGVPCWDRPSVLDALRQLGTLLSVDALLPGGTQRALITQFEESVLQVFLRGTAAMVPAPDFAYPVIERYAALDERVGLARLPSPGPSSSPLTLAGGDIAVLPRPGSPGGRELIGWLATEEAARQWARLGGFLAAQQGVRPASYPDPRLAELADVLRRPFAFDLSDELAGGDRLLRALQDFLAAVGDGRDQRVEEAARDMVQRMMAAEGRPW